MHRPTRLDVAQKAGVSPTTVSFVLNGRTDQGISERTWDLVLATAAELSYVPHAQARALRRGRSDIALVLLPALPPAAVLEQMRERLSTALRAVDLTCVFAQVVDPASSLSELRRSIEAAVVIAMYTLPETERRSLDATGTPYLDGLLDPLRAPAPLVDQRAIGEVQIRHLVDRGHRVIGYAGIADPLEQAFNVPRLVGAEEAARRWAGAPLSVRALDYQLPRARDAVEAWMTQGVTAVAAFNDLIAAAVLAACRAIGVHVPGDLAVVGVDDLEVAVMQDPPLTTVALDSGLAVDRAVAHVHALITGTSVPPPLVPLRTEEWITLIERGST